MASAESDLERCTTQSSSSTPASTDSTEPSSQTSVSAKQALRRRIFQRQREQGQKEKVETERQVEESRVLGNLRRIQERFSAAGYRSEVLAVTDKDSPFPTPKEFPPYVLLAFPLKKCSFDQTTGPFETVRLVFYADDS